MMLHNQAVFHFPLENDFVFYEGKLLYFQGSRFSPVFLWHFSELSHGLFFMCLDTTVVVQCYRVCYPVQIEGGRGEVREHGDGRSTRRAFFSLLLILLSKWEMWRFLKRAERDETRHSYALVFAYFENTITF